MIGNVPFVTVLNTGKKMDREMFNKALNAYASDENKNLSNLSSYAKEMRVYRKLMDIMEVLLDD